LILHDLLDVELHRLKITGGPRGLQTGALEFPSHVTRRLEMAFAAGIATFEIVARQIFDVRPPAFALGGEICCGRREQKAGGRRQAEE